MTLVIRSTQEFRNWRKQHEGKVIGFVPTMGALHAGHESLLIRSRKETEITVLSIFVNPTQFNNSEDFAKYPKTWDQDLAIAEKNNVDVIFAPTEKELYPFGYNYKLTENNLSQKLCGLHRPGHFDGVLTVVMKLFNIVRPQLAYFGEKDYQQLSLIQGMVERFFMDIKIIPRATVREPDGLAMSSRNVRLSPEERAKAPQIYQTLKASASAAEAASKLEKLGFKVDYVEDVDNRRYAAAFLGPVRLIDNVSI